MANPQSKPLPKQGIFEGRYVYSEIKAGSKTGESLLAFDNLTAQPVVVKRPSLLQPNPDVRRASIADLVREERALRVPAIARHPAVCHLLDAAGAEGREGQYRYLVLEQAAGTPVPALIHRYHDQGQPFPPSTYLGILHQLLNLLTAAHQAGLVYNDVKADHLFWDEQAETLKVIDWGNAQFIGETTSASPGTDVFQCGELLYQFVTGSRYAGGAAGEDSIGRPQWQAHFNQPVNPVLRRLISKALYPDPEQRYASAQAMSADLEGFALASGRSLTPTALPVSEPPATGPRSSSAPAGSPEFAALCQQLTQSIETGVTDVETLRSLEVSILDAARTEPEWQQAEYLKDLSEAYITLTSGQFTAAADRLKRVSTSPLRSSHWVALNELVQLAQAVEDGNVLKAEQASLALSASALGSGPGFGSLWFDSSRAFADLQLALNIFTTQPERAWPILETLPPMFRTRIVEQVLACSHMLQTGINHWRSAKFLEAADVFTQSLTDIGTLPTYLGVPLNTAASPVRRYQDKSHRNQKQLNELLAFVDSRQNRLAAPDLPIIREHIHEMAQGIPAVPGQPAHTKSRPEIWLQSIDRLLWLAQKGKSAAEIAGWTELIDPDEAVYGTFQNVNRVASEAAVLAAPRKPRRRRATFRERVLQNKFWIVVGVVAILAAGLGLAGYAASQRPVPQTPTELALASSIPSETPSLPATPNAVETACQEILAAQQAGQWQSVIDQAGLLLAQSSGADCGLQPLAQIEADAHDQLGQAAYTSGDYAEAIQNWTAAAGLDPASAPERALLLRCAAARADATQPVFQALLADYEAADVVAACGFNPADYLPATESPTAPLDFLEAMSARAVQLTVECENRPCPALFQDDSRRWHFGTFNEQSDGALLLTPRFQGMATGQTWGNTLQSIEIEFSVFNAQPYSFPTGSEFGLQVSFGAEQTVQVLLVAEPAFNTSVRVSGTDEDALGCGLLTTNKVAMHSSNGGLSHHSLTVRWETTDTFQFYLDGEAVCSDPIPSSGSPLVGIYYSGSDINMLIHQFVVTGVEP